MPVSRDSFTTHFGHSPLVKPDALKQAADKKAADNKTKGNLAMLLEQAEFLWYYTDMEKVMREPVGETGACWLPTPPNGYYRRYYLYGMPELLERVQQVDSHFSTAPQHLQTYWSNLKKMSDVAESLKHIGYVQGGTDAGL